MDIQSLLQQFASMPAGGAVPALGGSQGGALSSLGDISDLQKALQASNYQTDVATLTGGGALGVQSLDPVLKATIQEEEHFVLFRQLASTNATNIVDEYIRQTGVGGHLGGSVNTQMGVVRAAQGEYSREIGLVKFLMTLRQVGYVLNIGKNVVEAISIEETNGARQLATDAEYLLFYGNSAACPVEFDGILKIIQDEVNAGNVSPEHIYDMDGAALTTITPFSSVESAVYDFGSWGRITDAYLPTAVQTDLNRNLDPAYRWGPPNAGKQEIGMHVSGINLTQGVLKTHIDTFLHHESFPMAKPFEVSYPETATGNDAYKPASVTVDATVSDASSRFTTGRDGNYYWAVAGIGPSGQGQSTVRVTAQTAVATGKKATLTITASAGGAETGYAIYRSRKNGTNAASDLRLVKIIPKSGATTTFVDLNRLIPGSCSVPLLNMAPGADAIGWRQFLPMTKIPLPFGVGLQPVHSWFQFLFGYLRVTKPKHHGMIINIVPSTSAWKPFE